MNFSKSYFILFDPFNLFYSFLIYLSLSFSISFFPSNFFHLSLSAVFFLFPSLFLTHFYFCDYISLNLFCSTLWGVNCGRGRRVYLFEILETDWCEFFSGPKPYKNKFEKHIWFRHCQKVVFQCVDVCEIVKSVCICVWEWDSNQFLKKEETFWYFPSSSSLDWTDTRSKSFETFAKNQYLTHSPNL